MVYSESLVELLTADIPTTPIYEDTFLDATGQGHKETVVSRLYAYFLDKEKSEQIYSLFKDALVEIIFEKTGVDFFIDDFYCNCEQQTEKGNRIDLVLLSNNNDKAIIIENKIYHVLNNDLIDYYDSIKVASGNKVGIVLSLNYLHIAEELTGRFINITHKEWIDRIVKNGLPYGLTSKQYVYLNDFISNIYRLTQASEMNEQAKFFFKHTDLVLRANNTYDEAYKFIVSQLRVVGEQVGWSYKAEGESWGTLWDGVSQAYYVIGFEEMLKKERKIKIIIQLYKEARLKYEDIVAVFQDHPIFLRLEKDKPTQYHVNFVWKYYDVDEVALNDLAGFVSNKIANDFEPLMQEILNLLSK